MRLKEAYILHNTLATYQFSKVPYMYVTLKVYRLTSGAKEKKS